MRVAWDSLRGLALGDCFGETWFFRPAEQMRWPLENRVVPKGPWRWTDDTAMALSVYRMLTTRGEVVQDELAMLFAPAYEADPHRNNGAGMHDVLQAIGEGEPWGEAAAGAVAVAVAAALVAQGIPGRELIAATVERVARGVRAAA